MRKSDARPKVLQACRVLTDSPKGGASYADIQAMTGLSLGIIKDHAQRMKDSGDLIWLSDGFYRSPPPLREHCHVYINVMPNGDHRIQCGDRQITITQGSARLMKMAFGNHGHIGKNGQVEVDDEVFISVLLDGSMKVECGDQLLELSSLEARNLRAAIG